MTPEEKMRDIAECHGMCGNFCISCLEMHCLREIYDAMAELIRQRDEIKAKYEEIKCKYDEILERKKNS